MALRHLIKPVKLSFVGKTEIRSDIYSFNFAPDKPLKWKAGQHGLLELKISKGRISRKPFSIASAPSEGIIRIVTRIPKGEPNRFKDKLFKLKKGTPARLRGPVGPMYIKDYTKQYALLATGIGITPFMSILKQLEMEKNDKVKLTLFYVGNKDEFLFRDELSEINASLSNVSIKYIYMPERITGHVLEETLGNEIHQTIFFLSGSHKLVRSYRRTLHGLKIAHKNIKSNPFLSYKAYLASNVSSKLN